jgi:hypothetical protein
MSSADSLIQSKTDNITATEVLALKPWMLAQLKALGVPLTVKDASSQALADKILQDGLEAEHYEANLPLDTATWDAVQQQKLASLKGIFNADIATWNSGSGQPPLPPLPIPVPTPTSYGVAVRASGFSIPDGNGPNTVLGNGLPLDVDGVTHFLDDGVPTSFTFANGTTHLLHFQNAGVIGRQYFNHPAVYPGTSNGGEFYWYNWTLQTLNGKPYSFSNPPDISVSAAAAVEAIYKVFFSAMVFVEGFPAGRKITMTAIDKGTGATQTFQVPTGSFKNGGLISSRTNYVSAESDPTTTPPTPIPAGFLYVGHFTGEFFVLGHTYRLQVPYFVQDPVTGQWWSCELPNDGNVAWIDIDDAGVWVFPYTEKGP